MTSEEPWGKLVKDKEQGGFHAAHGGFPCSSFPARRHMMKPGQPRPARDQQHIYGIPGNTQAQQAEADKGRYDGIAHA